MRPNPGGPRRIAAVVPLALLAAGCATSGSGSGAPPPSRPASPTSAPPASAPARGSVTVDGVVQRGVEPGCLVLRAGTTSYLLLNGDGSTSARGVPIAVPVRVSGRILTGVASYCQQGAPLAVTAVTRR